MVTPEEAHDQHIKELDEVLEETEGCLDRVSTRKFSRVRKQQAFLETVINAKPKVPDNPFPPYSP